MNAFEIFPFEVWEKILEKLEDPKDKLILIMTDPALERDFQYKRKEWQFPAILSIFIANNNFYPISGNEREWKELEDAILSCRLVSSLCCKAIDDYTESHWNEKNCRPAFLPWSWFLFNETFSRFLKVRQGHPKDRPLLLNRNLVSVIGILSKNMIEQTYLLSKVLEMEGIHLKSFAAHVLAEDSSALDVAHYITRMLTLMPNLRDLCFIFSVPRQIIDSHHCNIIMPPLPNLRILKMTNSESADDTRKLLELLSFQEYFPQITDLEISFSLWKEEYNRNSRSLFPNLEYLSLKKTQLDSDMQIKKAKILKLLESIDAPKLKQILFQKCLTLPNNVSSNNTAMLVGKAGLSILKKRYPDFKWEASLDERDRRYRPYRPSSFDNFHCPILCFRKESKKKDKKKNCLKGCNIL